MELSNVKLKIIELLDAQYNQQFSESNLSARHYSFTSIDYDFSFSIRLIKDVSESQLVSRISRCIKKANEELKPNTHFQFSEDGELYIVSK